MQVYCQDKPMVMRITLFIGLIGWLATQGLWGQVADACPATHLIRYLQRQEQSWQAQHGVLETFNLALLAHLREEGSPPTWPVPPQRIFPPSLDWTQVPPDLQHDLRQRLSAFAQVSERVHLTLARLQGLALRGHFRADSGQQALDGLRLLQVLLEDARSLQGELVFLAQQVHLAHTPPQRSPAHALASSLSGLVVHSRVLLLAVATGVPARVARAQAQLRAACQQAATRHPTLLAQGAATPPLRDACGQTLALALALLEHTDSLLPVPARYQPWGATYHRFNHRLLPSMRALLEAFHRALALLPPGSALPVACELPRWRPLLPTRPPALATDLRDAPVQNLVFLVDVSGSMRRPEGLPRFRGAWQELVEVLRPEDHVGLVTFAGEGRVVLPATSGHQKARLRQALQRLDGQGNTRIHSGVLAGYAALRRQWTDRGHNCLVLVTDGGFDITEALLKDIERAQQRGTSLMVLYLGPPSARMEYRLRRLGETGGGTCLRLPADAPGPTLITAVQGLLAG